MAVDIERLTKLLMMTTSSHDMEALVAVRKANALLAENNLNWREFLASFGRPDNSFRVPPSQRPGARQNPFEQAGAGDNSSNKFTDADEINAYFEIALNEVGGSFRSFILSIHEWWQARGFLTSKQYYALRKAVEDRR